MELPDIEKYIFDPKSPRAFKAYDLLVKIVQDRENLVFFDPDFFTELFHKEIFNQDLERSLWDAPTNYHELSPMEKLAVFQNNFLITDFYLAVRNKLRRINQTYIISLFDKFYTDDTLKDETLEYNPIDIYTSFDIHRKGIRSQKKNLILFLNNDYGLLLENSRAERVSLLITTISVFKKVKKLPANFRPILLHDLSDIHQLLDLVRRDVKRKTSKDRKNQSSNKTAISYLDKIEIKNYFSLQHIKLSDLAKKKEIYLVGENGDGKTLLLQAILLGLKDNNVAGLAQDYILNNPQAKKLKVVATDDSKKEYSFSDGLSKSPKPYESVFGYGINRFRNDSDRKEDEGYLSLFSHDQFLENPVKWLQSIDYQEARDENPQISLSVAKEILKELLDENVEIDVSPSGVIFNERGTSVEFEQLSDGYRSVIVWACDLIARLSEKQPSVSTLNEFKGIIIVDEIGAYLHPKWQYSIVRKLRSWFPQIQFIFTTHSPIVIMGASDDAVFYKVYKEEGVTKITEPLDSISNLMANGIITSPLFGLEDARPASFDEEKEKIDTSDDYLAGKIHEAISQRIQQQNNITEDQIMALIQQELDKQLEK